LKIRSKLALLIAASAAAATLATAAGFLQLQRTTLADAEDEKNRLVLEAVRQSARESLLAKDPLMLLDALDAHIDAREEVHHARVLLGRKWEDVGGRSPKSPAGGLRSETVEVKSAGGKATVEVQFSKAALAARQRRALEAATTNILRIGGSVLGIGLLLAIPLGRLMTKRLVRIEEALIAIGEGKLGESVPAHGSDEIAQLAKGVNRMSGKLQEVEQMKKTFIASVTHELRSPLGAIDSYVKEMLSKENGWSEEDKASLGRIQKNASRLEHFVTSLLEMSKIERGKLDFYPRNGNLGHIVKDTAEFFRPRAKEAGIALTAEVSGGISGTRFDPDLISQVVTNLISNAIKFTRKGGQIRVSAYAKQAGVEIAVADSGVGISAEALPRVFRPFERVRNPLRATGAGLGLAICKSIVEMHGGTIKVESEVGTGSRFTFHIPAQPPVQKKTA
jgi:signal transduction histidine kinase